MAGKKQTDEARLAASLAALEANAKAQAQHDAEAAKLAADKRQQEQERQRLHQAIIGKKLDDAGLVQVGQYDDVVRTFRLGMLARECGLHTYPVGMIRVLFQAGSMLLDMVEDEAELQAHLEALVGDRPQAMHDREAVAEEVQ